MVGAPPRAALPSTEESDMLRIRSIVLPAVALVFTATCAPPPQPDPGPTVVQPADDLAAVALGVAIDARDDQGAPRLVRAVLPRPAPTGAASMTPDAAARAH